MKIFYRSYNEINDISSLEFIGKSPQLTTMNLYLQLIIV